MNNDDMSDDEFDAFLRGEDDLSRRLQGLTQPVSSPRLDAAILGYVRAGLAQEAQAAQAATVAQPARPAAANDAVIEGAPPQLAPGPGRRWRIPAGIAAGVLAGVLGHQVYQNSGTRMEERMAAAPAAEAPPQVAAVTVDMAQQPPPPAPPVAPPVVLAEAPPPVVGSPAPAIVRAARPELAEARQRPQPDQMRIAAAPPAQPAPMQRVEMTGSAIKRMEAESANPVQVQPRASVGDSFETSKPAYDGYNSDNPVPEMPVPPARVATAPPAPVSEVPYAVAARARAPAPVPAAAPPMVAAAPASVQKSLPAEAFEVPAVSSARSARPTARARAAETAAKEGGLELPKEAPSPAHDKRANDWLEVIDAMLKAKLDKDALAEWARFRAAYPDYPVPAATRKRIDAIKK